MPLPHNPFAAESYEEPIPYELTDEGIHAAAEAEAIREAAEAARLEAEWAQAEQATRVLAEGEAARLAAEAVAKQETPDATPEAVEGEPTQPEHVTQETPDEGTVDDDVTEQGDADRQAAVSATDEGAESVSDGADSHDVGPVTSETVPAEQEGDVGEPPAGDLPAEPPKPAPPVKKAAAKPRKQTAKKPA